ncbi:MAG: carotenoid biosynthesis protein [Deltaproteobacteria bacterium]|nr:carotenoid biosynthesis protein [Deltaproteobacteria bacterium]MBI4224519.1 carotenoid biosynthesis protein [Deltaproteobacteria bacterium]
MDRGLGTTLCPELVEGGYGPFLTTFLNRPYVVLFLVTFLVLALLHLGILRTLIWLVWGYAIAFLSEYASIHNGFPYGLYHYIPESFAGELVLAGVPVWDSISYPFIAYASYATAWFLIEPHFGKFKMDPHVSPSRPLPVVGLAAILMMLADVVIDPTATMGEKWFLGKVHYYPDGGIYFGVPLSNFAGWLLVAFVILAGWQILEKSLLARFRLPVWPARRFPFQGLLGPLFYFGILGFMLAVQLAIGAHFLLAASFAITLCTALLVIKKSLINLSIRK